MRYNPFKYIILATGKFILFLLILPTFYSCGDKNSRGLIPEKDFTAILSDAYLADGLLLVPAIRDKFLLKDSVSCYVDIINSHGYTYEQMEKTLNYYFIYDAKEMVSIYDNISEKLNAKELNISAELQKEAFANEETTKKNFKFSLPDPEMKRKPGFSYDINPPGMFTLVFSVTVYPDDQSYHPSFISWYSTAEGPDAGKIKYLQEIRYIKDGWPHTYTVKGRIPWDKKTKLEGFFFNYENNPGFCWQHAEILNLNFLFTCDVR
jgi:hypothetical protein